MWNLDVQPFELMARSASVFFFIFIIFRIWGKKHFGQLTAFDFVFLVIISETTQNAMVGDDKSVSGCFIAITTLVLLNVILDKLSFRSKKLEKIIDGKPEIIVKDGYLDLNCMKEQGITINELEEALREEGVLHVREVRQATLEPNGHISVVKKSDAGIMSRIFS